MEEEVKLANSTIELTDLEIKVVDNIRNTINGLQQQLNVALTMAFASRHIENFNASSIDGNKVTYN